MRPPVKLEGKLVDIKFSETSAVSLSLAGRASVYDQTVNAPTIAGYKARGIVGQWLSGNRHAGCSFGRVWLSQTDQQVMYSLVNDGTNEATLSIKFYLMYLPES